MNIDIDKEKFKEYVNTKRVDDIRICHIHSIALNQMRYHKGQLPKDSMYADILDTVGYVDLIMVKPIWDGWKFIDGRMGGTITQFTNTWAYRVNRSNNRFNLDNYKKWLIEERDSKIQTLLSVKECKIK
jgi:hypothetical protein